MRRIIAVAAATLLLAPVAWAANPGDVVINEVAWMGAGGNEEWIELYNNTGSDVSLAGWYIMDDGATQYDLSGTILARSYFLIEKQETATPLAADLIVGTISLADDGDSLELFDSLDNSIDLLDTAAGWYEGVVGVDDYTMERRNTDVPGIIPTNWGDNDGVTFDNALYAALSMYGTPGADNSVIGTFVAGADVVHIHNLSATEADVYFTEEVTAPTAENLAYYTVDGAINPVTAALDGSDATLVHLTFAAGDLVVEGGPYTLAVLGVMNTVGDASNATAQFVGGVSSIAFARGDADTSYVPDLLELYPDAFFTVQGVVTTAGDFDNRDGALQDISGGITIWDASSSVIPNITRGDEIRISGKPGQYNGKDQLIDPMAFVVSQGNVVDPIMATVADLLVAGAGELYESMLIGIIGVSNTGGGDAWPAGGSWANMEITDDGGASLYTLHIDDYTEIDGSPEPAWPIDVQGIASQYDTVDPLDGDYNVMPRDLADLDPNGGFCGTMGATQDCYTGPAGTEVNLPCHTGTQTCDGTYWGACVGEQTPLSATDDNCDDVDDDCDGATDDEVDFQNDPQHCGDCATNCTALPNAAGSTCAFGTCTLVCDAGYGDCDSNVATGCEVTLGTDTDCSACGDDCTALPNAAGSTCAVDTCTLVCDATYGDCDNDTATGCETSLTSTDYCGDCNIACGAGESCVDNAGVWECTPDCPDADDDGYADVACGGTDCDDVDPAVNPEATEVCDEVDNDCDGDTDEDWPEIGEACDGADEDECANGTLVCAAAGDTLECDGDAPAFEEACNGEDDDCDGDTDEDWPDLGEACDGEDEDECPNGQLECNAAKNGVVCEEHGQAKEELCNGMDDDCDGETDEGFGEYTCGDGECAVTTNACDNGEWRSCVQGDPPENVEKTCDDGLDNDCDTFVDENDLDCIGGSGGDGCGCSASGDDRSGVLLMLLIGLVAALRRRLRV